MPQALAGTTPMDGDNLPQSISLSTIRQGSADSGQEEGLLKSLNI